MQLKISWITYTDDNLNSPRGIATSSNELPNWIIYGLGMDKGRRSNQWLEIKLLQIMQIQQNYNLFPIGNYAKAEQ